MEEELTLKLASFIKGKDFWRECSPDYPPCCICKRIISTVGIRFFNKNGTEISFHISCINKELKKEFITPVCNEDFLTNNKDCLDLECSHCKEYQNCSFISLEGKNEIRFYKMKITNEIPEGVVVKSGNPIILDDKFAQEIGFISEIFTSASYLWKNENEITLPVIFIKDNLQNQGHFQRFLKNLIEKKYVIRIIKPISDIMLHILKKYEFEKEWELDEIYNEYVEVWTKKPKSKCKFDIDGICHANGCYSDEKCNARDNEGHPKYKSLDFLIPRNEYANRYGEE